MTRDLLGDLRTFSMKFFDQKAQELKAEQRYSLADNIQSKKWGSMQSMSVEKRHLFGEEVLQEIVECADGVNHSLQTVDEVATEEEAAAL